MREILTTFAAVLLATAGGGVVLALPRIPAPVQPDDAQVGRVLAEARRCGDDELDRASTLHLRASQLGALQSPAKELPNPFVSEYTTVIGRLLHCSDSVEELLSKEKLSRNDVTAMEAWRTIFYANVVRQLKGQYQVLYP